ncbi:MAG: YkgJ family cysteine cluster protein [Desulfovibrionaceae bacterium]
MKEPFACQMCGVCCQGEGGIVVSSRDADRLSAHLGMSVQDMAARYLTAQGHKLRLVSGEDGACVFYEQGRGCSVHPGRPDICRAWPFFRGNMLDGESFLMAREDCPGIDPEADHGAFVQQGAAYLIREELWGYGDPEAPNALFPGPEALRAALGHGYRRD